MKRILLTLATTAIAAPLAAHETREMGAHVHGVSALNIAIEGNEVAMELRSPGADIVGFEYQAESDADKAAVATALAMLSDPLTLFVMPEAAGCTLTSAEAELDGADHAAHDNGHGHDEDHAEGHDHDNDHDHDAHEAEGGHSEFHAEYAITCSEPGALTQITFAWFDAFPNAREVAVQIVSDTGARSFEVERGDPVLRLGD